MLTTLTEPTRFDERIEALLQQGPAEHKADRLVEALATFAEAERLAKELGDQRAADRAFVNWCTSSLKLERALRGEHLGRLRAILMAGDDAVSSRLAAYNIARAYEFRKEFRKGLFYAQTALHRSLRLDLPGWVASSHNQIGNFLLAQSRFEDACGEYEEALALLPAGPSRRKALILTNLGYSRAVLGHSGALALIYRSLRMLRRLGARRDTIIPHLDLCYALLEAGRCRHAVSHGVRALALAEEAAEHDSIRHALFLLGEASQQRGNPELAREHFRRLQERYFPESPHLADLLLSVDVRKLINLKA